MAFSGLKSAVVILLCFSTRTTAAQEVTTTKTDPDKSAALTALEYVERIRNSPCTGGTEEVLPVQFEHSIWSAYAEVAVRMSNLLTKSIIRNGNSLRGVTDEFLFDLVRNNVDGDSLLFGSAIAVEEWTYPRYRIFCPYAYKKTIVYAHDLSLNYNYLDPNTEWYHVLRMKNWEHAFVSQNKVTYRHNGTTHSTQSVLYQPLSGLDDGHWTLPYYDCGGGDIWMVTYSSPIFGMVGSRPTFKGIGTIDIELTNIDINQCDLDSADGSDAADAGQQAAESAGSVDVFRGTHRCRSSTKCVAVTGKGFVPGAYRCACQDGYYFPQTSIPESQKYYDGTEIESALTNASASLGSQYTCLVCAEGCDTCVDDSPCLYSYILPLRVTLLVLSVILMMLIGLTSAMVAVYREKKVIKSASPIFLHIVCAGAILMVCPMLIFYSEATNVTCIVGSWPRHIGFCLAYGGLLLKTWRITAIFQVKSAKKLNLSDRVLLQRLLPFVGVTVAYLAAWSGLANESSQWQRTASDLKFTNCPSDWWAYGIVIAQGAFLLWGAYLCYVVRRAPSVFNESKYITWTIYNNIIVGSFIIVAREFIAIRQGPDIIYVFDFLYTQVSVTSLVCLIFIPKLWVVYKNGPLDEVEDMETVNSHIKTMTTNAVTSFEYTADKQVQVELISSPISVITTDPVSYLAIPDRTTSAHGQNPFPSNKVAPE